MRYPGEVYLLPPEIRPGGDPKTRPYVLLTEADEETLISTLAFCSSSGEETGRGAAAHLVDPFKTTYRSTGFDRPTYVYGSRLLTEETDVLGGHVGRIIDEMPLIRDALRTALGIATGTGAGKYAAASGSYRGQVVRLTAEMTEVCGFANCVVVTEPRYSKRRRYQTVVPILDGKFPEIDAAVTAETDQWLNPSLLPIGLVRIYISFITSVFHPREIQDELAVIVDNSTMDKIDNALLLYFGL